MSTTFEIGRMPGGDAPGLSHSGDAPDGHALEGARGEPRAPVEVVDRDPHDVGRRPGARGGRDVVLERRRRRSRRPPRSRATPRTAHQVAAVRGDLEVEHLSDEREVVAGVGAGLVAVPGSRGSRRARRTAAARARTGSSRPRPRPRSFAWRSGPAAGSTAPGAPRRRCRRRRSSRRRRRSGGARAPPRRPGTAAACRRSGACRTRRPCRPGSARRCPRWAAGRAARCGRPRARTAPGAPRAGRRRRQIERDVVAEPRDGHLHRAGNCSRNRRSLSYSIRRSGEAVLEERDPLDAHAEGEALPDRRCRGPAMSSTFGSTSPAPRISTQPECLQTAQPAPSQRKQDTSTSTLGSVNGKKLVRKRVSRSAPNSGAGEVRRACP